MVKLNPEISIESKNQLSRNCTDQDGSALSLNADEFNLNVKNSKENILTDLNKFISKFMMKEPGNVPITKNEKQEMESVRRYVNQNMEVGATGRSFERCQ